jgi:hypothetical protein
VNVIVNEPYPVIWGYEKPHEVQEDPLVFFFLPFERFLIFSITIAITRSSNGEKNGLPFLAFDESSLNA